MSDLPPWITPEQYAVLRTLLLAFDDLGWPAQATGGLAGNLHGSPWPLHDLDFDVEAAALAPLSARFRDQVVVGPAPHRDEEFALDLLTLRFGRVEVDLVSAESIHLVDRSGRLVHAPTDLRVSVLRPLGALRVPTMPLERLIAYKRVIGRVDDVADLERLRGAAGPGSR